MSGPRFEMHDGKWKVSAHRLLVSCIYYYVCMTIIHMLNIYCVSNGA